MEDLPEFSLKKVLTAAVFWSGVLLIWAGTWITSGFGNSLIVAGLILVVARVARWVMMEF